MMVDRMLNYTPDGK